jgi:hypothetical protein
VDTATIELIKALTGVAGALTGIAGVTIAGFGLRTWRRQLYGTAEYERSRRLYRAVLEVRDQLEAVRSPFVSVGETTTAFREAGVEPEGEDVSKAKRTNELVYERRWQGVVKAMSELRLELLEAEVLWGEKVREPERTLRSCMAELYTAVHFHVQDRAPSGLREKHHDLLYRQGSLDEPDEFSKRIAAAVAGFETLVRPHLTTRLARLKSGRLLR